SRHLSLDVLREHVEISRSSERRSQPPQLRAQIVRPPLVEERSRRSQKRSCPPRRDSHLVKVLGIDPQPGAGVVGQQPVVLLTQRRAQPLGWTRVWRKLDGSRRIGELQDAIELRLEGTRLRSGVPKRSLEPTKRTLIALDQLDLQLAEPTRH